MGGGLKPYADFVDQIASDRFGLTVDIEFFKTTRSVSRIYPEEVPS
jgi:hypothetical protein